MMRRLAPNALRHRDTLKFMPAARRFRAHLRIWDIAFVLALAVFAYGYLTDAPFVMLVDLLVLVPLAFVEIFRAFRFVTQHLLWSLRNRLLFVYALFGVLPVLLLFVLFALVAWSFMSELAISLANAELEHRLDGMQSAVDAVNRVPAGFRRTALPEIQKAFSFSYPRIAFYIKDESGSYRAPANAPDFDVPPGWGNVHGLLVYRDRFYCWGHYVDSNRQVTVVSPLSNEVIADLVPNLGVIALFEDNGHRVVATGSVSDDHAPSGASGPVRGRLPAPANRLDIPVELPATQRHMHLEHPGEWHNAILLVHSRPSAVLSRAFSDSDVVRGIVADLLIGIALLFLLVELAAMLVGISLSRRITRAVNQLYQGTQQVISGDFSHRIPVTSEDQLGGLGRSFNHMTTHLERLLSVEKERERLQAEIEIAREVQSQLYPRGQPPRCGFRLTARCDPARMVSGDYYDYQLVGKDKLAFAIGDVAGKGISAALLMATIQSALRAQVSESLPESPNECSPVPEIESSALVSKLNKQVFAHTAPEKYATFFFGLYDNATRTLTYTNAGHLSPLLFRNGSVVPLDTNGTVIGAFANSKYDESCITVENDDLLVCYTDGITEPENAYGEEFGVDRLIELVKKHKSADDSEIIRAVFDAVRSWTGTPELHDDMTLLLARQVETS